MGRERLPNRRQNETMCLRHDGQEFTVTIGYGGDGKPKEVFAGAAKSGTAMSHILADACVIISLALQYGAEPEDITRSLGRVPDLDRGKGTEKPASVLGEILEFIASARSEWPSAVKRLGFDAAPDYGAPTPEGGR